MGLVSCSVQSVVAQLCCQPRPPGLCCAMVLEEDPLGEGLTMDWPVPDGSCKLGALVDEGPLKCLQDGADCLQVGADWTTESEGFLVETGESSQGFLDDTLPMGTVGNEKGGLLTPPLREGVPVAIPDECEAGAALPGIPMWACSTPDEATGTVAMQMGVGNWGLVAAQADPGAATRMVRKRGHRGDTVEAPNAKRSCSQARGDDASKHVEEEKEEKADDGEEKKAADGAALVDNAGDVLPMFHGATYKTANSAASCAYKRAKLGGANAEAIAEAAAAARREWKAVHGLDEPKGV